MDNINVFNQYDNVVFDLGGGMQSEAELTAGVYCFWLNIAERY